MRGRWSAHPEDGLIRSMPDLAEAILSAACAALIVLFGAFLIVGLELLRGNQPERVAAVPAWSAPLVLLVALVPVALAYRWARPRGHHYFPWILLGLTVWIAGALVVLTRLG